MTAEQLKELMALEAYWRGQAQGEKLGGNVVKEASCNGISCGVRMAIGLLQGNSLTAEESIGLGHVSDGFHTFNELYAHRHALLLAVMKLGDYVKAPLKLGNHTWISQRHHDGTSYAGWFIAGVTLPTGPITYHLPDAMWLDAVETGAQILDQAPEWDGHTSNDVRDRIMEWIKK